MTEVVYLLTYEEFILLLAAAEIRTLYGFQFELQPPDRENSLQLLKELCLKGYLISDGKEFKAAGEMRQVLTRLREAKTVLEVHKTSGRGCFFYVGETESIRLSKSLRRKEILELQCIRTEEVWKWMMEEGWVPSGSSRKTEPGKGVGEHDSDRNLYTGAESDL